MYLHTLIYVSTHFNFQFAKTLEKINIDCNANDGYSCPVRYMVLIHNSRETMVNDFVTDPYVTMGIREEKWILISKSNLKSIQTQENPCSKDDDKSIRTECKLRKVPVISWFILLGVE